MPTGYYTRIRQSLRPPVHVIGPSIAYIPLTKGLYALIDREDAERVGAFNWHSHKGWREGWYAAKGCKPYLMHRFILPTTLEVDHKNCNGLGNRKANLRVATSQQNKANKRVSVNNSSGFKGVIKTRWGWRAAGWCNNKSKHLGLFETVQEAHAAYCAFAREKFGEFANDGIKTLSED